MLMPHIHGGSWWDWVGFPRSEQGKTLLLGVLAGVVVCGGGCCWVVRVNRHAAVAAGRVEQRWIAGEAYINSLCINDQECKISFF